jgi:hypothetical protein
LKSGFLAYVFVNIPGPHPERVYTGVEIGKFFFGFRAQGSPVLTVSLQEAAIPGLSFRLEKWGGELETEVPLLELKNRDRVPGVIIYHAAFEKRFPIDPYFTDKGLKGKIVILFYGGVDAQQAVNTGKPNHPAPGIGINGVHLFKWKSEIGFSDYVVGTVRPGHGLEVSLFGMDPDIFMVIFGNAKDTP